MARKKTETAEAGLPAWFRSAHHRVEARGIVAISTGDLLAEDGLPVNAAARAQAMKLRRAPAAVAADPAPAVPGTTEAQKPAAPDAPAADQE